LAWCFASSRFQVPSPQPLTPSPQTLAARPQTLDSARPEAERRQLTVMFCDLVGSTALSAKLDPEELREVMRVYQETCTGVIRRYDGHIAQHLGDGLLVYFGYPVAHEDDAQRAVRAGLEIVEMLRTRGLSPLSAQPLQVRIGIHTGLVVIGEIGSSEKREILALGETPNLAARLQALAEPDTLVISAATQRLVQGLFACQDLGLQDLKGITTPIKVYQVLGESGMQSRFEVAVQAGLTPLVGRDEELALLRRRWRQAQDGEGQVVLLSGEPGIGKSRLVQELKDHVTQDGAIRIEFRCSPYHQNSALYPLIEHLQRVLHFALGDIPQDKLRKLEQTLARYRFPQADTVPLLAALLSLPQPEGLPPLTLSPQRQKQKTLDTLVRWLFEEAERAVVYAVWEDLHWADPSTLEFLGVCLGQVPTARMLKVLTFRPEFTPPWASRSHFSHLVLSRLGRTQSSTIVEQLTGGKALPAEVVHQIVAKTDGVPLFVEELTKSVVESVGAHSSASLQSLGIPATLHDSLMARLDRLGAAKEIAQVGAVLGREFSYELLYAVSAVDEDTFQHGLRQLVEAELVYQSGLPPQARYLFKHALVQDTAYQSLLKSRRQQLHHQVAQVLEEKFPETKETQPELLAHHCTEAGLTERAIPYWQQAGERASQRSAYEEAVAHLTQGLEVLKTLPDTPERAQQELFLQLALNMALLAIRGYTAPEVEKAATRARELCQQLGETLLLVPVLDRLAMFYFVRGEVQTARELAEQMLRLAQSAQDRYLLLMAYARLGIPLYLLGELTSARTHSEQAMALYDPQTHPRSTISTHDPRVDCLSYASWTLWQLGYPEQALRRSQEALALAEGLSRPFSLAVALGFAARFHVLRREGQVARERAEAVMTLSTEQGFPYWLAWGMEVQGWALAEQGQMQEGIAQMRQSRDPFVLALLAEAYGKVGQVEEGLTVLAKALAFVDRTGHRVYEAELYRLKGELSLQKSRVGIAHHDISVAVVGTVGRAHPTGDEEAEACFHKAIEIARKQQAKSLELRAVTSLAKLWQRQGR
jgi:class 3 adenylate cyclase/tetratricopeptide (TPR) repeat protein